MAKFTKKSGIFDGLDHKDDVDTHVYTHTPTPTPKVKERKKFRAQILTYPSLIEKMDAYAKAHGMSRAEVFEQAVGEFLERNT